MYAKVYAYIKEKDKTGIYVNTLRWNFHGITYCIFEVGEGPPDITQNKGTSINVHYLRQIYEAIKIKITKLKENHLYCWSLSHIKQHLKFTTDQQVDILKLKLLVLLLYGNCSVQC